MNKPRRFSASDLAGLSQRTRRMLVLGVHGGDGEESPLTLDDLLARVDGIAELTDADLATLESDLLDQADALAAEATATHDDEALANLRRCAAAVETVRTTAGERIAHAEEVAAEVDSITNALNGEPAEDAAAADDTAAGDEAAEGADAPAADGEAAAQAAEDESGEGEAAADETVAASAAPRVSRVAARRPEHARPRERHAPPMQVLRASANVPGMQAGEMLSHNDGTPDHDKIAAAFQHVLRASAGYRGPRIEMPVMTLGVFDPSEVFGEARTLRYDARANGPKIDAVTSRESLRASGGVCAPPPIQYDLPILGSDARPVKDALANFGADRGGVRLLPPPLLSDVEGAISIWTEANDITPADPLTKPCLRLDCPAEYETMVDAIPSCLEIGNFRARFFPEQVAAWVKLASVQHAKIAEQKILDKMGSDSTQVSVTQVLGSARDVLAAVERAGAGIRNRHRIDPDFPLRFLAPAWLRKNMVTDLIRESPGSTAERLATTDAEIEGFLRARNINVSWFLDGETGTDQIFGPQGDGLLLGWPDSAICYLYIEGQWLFLDGGSLDLGVVRDSTLNSTNDFQMFSETFENSVFHGYESYRLDLAICADGSAAALVDTSGICAAGS